MIRMEKGEDDEDEIPDEPPPFQNDVDLVIRLWLEHKLHHTFPEAGGYLDQDSSLMEDFHIMNVHYVRILKGVSSTSLLPESGASWMDGMERE